MLPTIEVQNLGKKYIISHSVGSPYRTFGESLSEGIKNLGKALLKRGDRHETREEFWALRGIEFEIHQGEKIGIIGRNGAGKTTLLKILSRITVPTEGRAVIRGRVSSLLEVGTGFHPELSGRENIYLNGSILGMSKKEIRKKFDEIVAFAEVEKFLDTPVKRFSSGMYVRLAFAVAAHLEPEILLIDEVLAVGDAEFQKKCLGKMDSISRGGRTLLFVSHNLPMIRSLCPKTILLEKGKMMDYDKTEKVIEKYILQSGIVKDAVVDLSDSERSGGNQKAILSAWIENPGGSKVNTVLMGSAVKICFHFRLKKTLRDPNFGFGIENLEGQRIFSLNNKIAHHHSLESLEEGVAFFSIPELILVPGTYFIDLSIVDGLTEMIDYVKGALTMNVVADDVFRTGRILHKYHGVIYVKGNIGVEKK
jgi:lipopolysaccharide transport system ATP-binding protein